MFRNILNTTIVKIVNTLVAFAILMISARLLGPAAMGTIGLILLAITIILLLNNLVGSGALVFLVPRYSLGMIARISYGWTFIASGVGIACFVLLKIEPTEYAIDIFFLSLIFGFNFVNQNILIGKGLIRFFNLISFIQYMMMIILVVLLFYVLDVPSIRNYLLTLYVSWSLHLVLGTVKVLSLVSGHPVKETRGLIRDMLRYGFYVQIANLTQFFNYRLTYYFVESFLGRASLGVFEIGNKFADGIWLFGKSIAMVQYSWIANSKQGDDTVTLTLRLFKFSTMLTLFLVLIMVALPESVYLFLFGARFEGVHEVLVWLAPGIVFMSGAMILSHHFAGTGKYHINTIGSLIGLGFIVLLCFLLVPQYGLKGAALAASITYFISLLYLLIVFGATSRAPWKSYTMRRSDIRFFIDLLRRQLQMVKKSGE
ncbi:MAG: polysaccharide biosynthesis C-terminal domain-containing protein [Bacteroidales bacterium]